MDNDGEGGWCPSYFSYQVSKRVWVTLVFFSHKSVVILNTTTVLILPIGVQASFIQTKERA